MPKIFVSYRQADNADFVYRIRDWLMNRYGKDNVFIDFDGLPPFVLFEEVIRERIQESDAVLIIIGPQWMPLLNQRAAGGDKDYVKIEVETALARSGLIIAPVLIKGAEMPTRRDLSESLRRLCDINAARLMDGGKMFESEIKTLMDAIDAAIIRGHSNASASTASEQRRKAEQLTAQGVEKGINGDYDGEIADETKAIRVDPTYAPAYAERAGAWGLKGEFGKAIKDADKALHLDKNNVLAYKNRAWAHDSKQNYDEAIADYTEAIRLEPTVVESYVNRGMVRIAKSDYAGAVSDFTAAIHLSPGIAVFHESRGIARNGSGDYDGAIDDYNEAIRLDPNSAETYGNRGKSYDNRGQHALANKDYRRYIALGGDKREAVEELIRENEKLLKRK